MRQAVLTKSKQFEIFETDVPPVGERDVLIRVLTCGMCTGELHVWADSSGGNYPIRLGHEVVGEIVEIGPAVTGVKVGDMVAAINQHSGFAEFCTTPVESVALLPANLSPKTALGEPLACAVNATRRIGATDESTVVLIGCGFMGLLLIQCLKAQGVANIIAVDVRAESVQRAKELGADVALNATLDNVAEVVQQMTLGQGADVVVEATGTQSGLDLCTDLVRIRGLLAVYGYHQGGTRQVNMQLWNWKGLDIVNAHERDVSVYVEGMKIGLDLVSSGKVDLASLITHRFPLDEINSAFGIAARKAEGYVKGTIDL